MPLNKRLPIYAPKQWFEDRERAIKEDCNGCGSELDLSGKLVPNDLYGLDISKEGCCPHDFMYKYGMTWLDKLFADVMFLYNLVALILNAAHGKRFWQKERLLVIPRLLRATKYFVAVVRFGDDSFADGKEFVSDEKHITFRGEFR